MSARPTNRPLWGVTCEAGHWGWWLARCGCLLGFFCTCLRAFLGGMARSQGLCCLSRPRSQDQHTQVSETTGLRTKSDPRLPGPPLIACIKANAMPLLA